MGGLYRGAFMKTLILAMAAALALGPPATAQPAATTPAAASSTTNTVLPAGLGVEVRVEKLVTSLDFERGQTFPIALNRDVTVDGVVLLPAGTPGVAEVVHVDPAGDQARPGELLIALRYLTYQGRKVALKGGRLAIKGMETQQYNGFGTLYIGYQAAIPPGRLIEAELAEPLDLGRDLGVVVPPPALPDRLTRPLPGGLTPPPPGKARVVFFRPSVGLSIMTGFKIRLGPEKGRELGTSINGEWFTVTLDPGRYEFTGTQERRDSLFIDLEAGETYFVQAKVLVGTWAGHPNLFPAERAVFAANVGKMKQRKAAGE